MGYRVDYDKMNDILAVWSETYHVYAPAWDQRKKKVRYREIKTVDQIVLDRQADFSPKEAYYPVSQTMFYFTDTEVTESELAATFTGQRIMRRRVPRGTSGISSAASIASSHAPAVRGRIPSRSHAPESTPENVSTSKMVASSIPTVIFFASLFGVIMRAFGGFMRGGKR